MNKLLITLIGALTLGAALPALAGPDFAAIERARKANQVAQAERQAHVYLVQGPVGAKPAQCPVAPLVLPLDHGPRAQTTPGENRLRRARYEAQAKACKDAAK